MTKPKMIYVREDAVRQLRSYQILVTVDVYLCVIRDEMIVYKGYLGQSGTSDSIRSLLGTGELVPINSWSEEGLTYEKYSNEDLERSWNKIVKSADGLQNLKKVPTEGSWGILYEY